MDRGGWSAEAGPAGDWTAEAGLRRMDRGGWTGEVELEGCVAQRRLMAWL